MKNGWYDDFDRKLHYVDGKIHRDDGPASIWDDGGEAWYRKGLRHRDGGPAICRPDGSKTWYQNGLRHREDGPAVSNSDGSEMFFLHGEIIHPLLFFVNQKIDP